MTAEPLVAIVAATSINWQQLVAGMQEATGLMIATPIDNSSVSPTSPIAFPLSMAYVFGDDRKIRATDFLHDDYLSLIQVSCLCSFDVRQRFNVTYEVRLPRRWIEGKDTDRDILLITGSLPQWRNQIVEFKQAEEEYPRKVGHAFDHLFRKHNYGFIFR